MHESVNATILPFYHMSAGLNSCPTCKTYLFLFEKCYSLYFKKACSNTLKKTTQSYYTTAENLKNFLSYTSDYFTPPVKTVTWGLRQKN